MTQSQLNSTAKRINTALVQFGKTFGVNSPAYKRYESQIINAVGSKNVHRTKSGHVAINLGKQLFNLEEKLKELDKPSNKVKGRQKEAENILKQIEKENNPSKDIEKIKIPKSKIIEAVNKFSSIQNFFEEQITDYYVLRNEVPRIDEILKQFEEKRGSKLSYSELLKSIDELEELMNEYNEKNSPSIISDEEIENKRKSGKFLK